MQRHSPHRTLHVLLASIVAALLCSCDAWPGIVTASWYEDVLLHSGQVINVHRKVTNRGSWPEGAGRGPIVQQSAEFELGGKRYTWEGSSVWPAQGMPDILDVVGGAPVVAMPLEGWSECSHWGFPPEGLVAVSFRDGRWQRVEIATLPRDLKVNLIRTTPGREFWKQRLDATMKRKFDQSHPSLRIGTTLDRLAKAYSEGMEACAIMNVTADPELERRRVESGLAQRAAPTLTAEVLSTDSETGFLLIDRPGTWNDLARISESCDRIIDDVRHAYNWNGPDASPRSTSVGWDLIAHGEPGMRIPLANVDRVPLHDIVCDARTVFAVMRPSERSLIIHQFTSRGDRERVVNVALPPAPAKPSGGDWGRVWSISVDSAGHLDVAIVESVRGSERRTAKTHYRAQLPTN